MTMLRLMLQMDEDKLPLAMLHSFCFSPCPPPLRLGPPLLDATSRPRPRTSHESCSHLAPAHCNESIRLIACLPVCLPACADKRDGAIRALRTSRPPSACSAQGTPLGTSRPSGRTSGSVGACPPQYAEAVPPANAAATRIGEDTLPRRLASALEQRRQAATVALVCDSVELLVIYLAATSRG